MKLYLISRTGRIGYDETIAVVVAASSPKRARNMIVGGDEDLCVWLDPKKSTCKIIADCAKLDVEEGVVLESFNAG